MLTSDINIHHNSDLWAVWFQNKRPRRAYKEESLLRSLQPRKKEIGARRNRERKGIQIRLMVFQNSWRRKRKIKTGRVRVVARREKKKAKRRYLSKILKTLSILSPPF
jgi:hypothetical protein